MNAIQHPLAKGSRLILGIPAFDDVDVPAGASAEIIDVRQRGSSGFSYVIRFMDVNDPDDVSARLRREFHSSDFPFELVGAGGA